MKINLFWNRRTFFKRAALIGGSALFAAFRHPHTIQAEATSPKHSKSQQGYRLTEHVKRYYEKARQ